MQASFRRRLLGALALGALALFGAACSSDDGGSASTTAGGTTPDATTTPVAYPHDDELRLHQIQVVGTHNSYHLAPEAGFAQAAADEYGLQLASLFGYSHRPLPEQFTEQGIRQIELDVFADPDGTLYANRKAHALAGLPPDGGIAELHDPGFKVLHVQEIDLESTCPTFVVCLQQVEDWSEANPGHLPIAILVEAKADVIPDPYDMGFVDPLPIGPAELDALDAEIRSVFDDDQLITPDLVRGDHATLDEAVTTEGWPTLGAVRGRVGFFLDNGGEVAEAYREGHPALEGRAMFTGDAPAGDPSAAFMKLNDPVADFDAIQSAVRAGYLVRTRSDADAHLSPDDPSPQRDKAIASGAQFISTDYPDGGLKAFPDYRVVLDGGTPAICNPLNAPDWCTPADVENPAHLAG